MPISLAFGAPTGVSSNINARHARREVTWLAGGIAGSRLWISAPRRTAIWRSDAHYPVIDTTAHEVHRGAITSLRTEDCLLVVDKVVRSDRVVGYMKRPSPAITGSKPESPLAKSLPRNLRASRLPTHASMGRRLRFQADHSVKATELQESGPSAVRSSSMMTVQPRPKAPGRCLSAVAKEL